MFIKSRIEIGERIKRDLRIIFPQNTKTYTIKHLFQFEVGVFVYKEILNTKHKERSC